MAPEPDSDPPRQPRPKLSWKRVAVAALATFGIAAVALTTFELVTGQALSGGDGTTIQQVREWIHRRVGYQEEEDTVEGADRRSDDR